MERAAENVLTEIAGIVHLLWVEGHGQWTCHVLISCWLQNWLGLTTLQRKDRDEFLGALIVTWGLFGSMSSATKHCKVEEVQLNLLQASDSAKRREKMQHCNSVRQTERWHGRALIPVSAAVTQLAQMETQQPRSQRDHPENSEGLDQHCLTGLMVWTRERPDSGHISGITNSFHFCVKFSPVPVFCCFMFMLLLVSPANAENVLIKTQNILKSKYPPSLPP